VASLLLNANKVIKLSLSPLFFSLDINGTRYTSIPWILKNREMASSKLKKSDLRAYDLAAAGQ